VAACGAGTASAQQHCERIAAAQAQASTAAYLAQNAIAGAGGPRLILAAHSFLQDKLMAPPWCDSLTSPWRSGQALQHGSCGQQLARCGASCCNGLDPAAWTLLQVQGPASTATAPPPPLLLPDHHHHQQPGGTAARAPTSLLSRHHAHTTQPPTQGAHCWQAVATTTQQHGIKPAAARSSTAPTLPSSTHHPSSPASGAAPAIATPSAQEQARSRAPETLAASLPRNHHAQQHAWPAPHGATPLETRAFQGALAQFTAPL
jgi:hypothetical protein